jgi:hypothetical protein
VTTADIARLVDNMFTETLEAYADCVDGIDDREKVTPALRTYFAKHGVALWDDEDE